MDHLQELPMRIRKYPLDAIYEFDSLDELREFDPKYKECSGSAILRDMAERLDCIEGELKQIKPWKDAVGAVNGIQFYSPKGSCRYTYETKKLEVYSNEQ